ncbi:unnamed protein product [Effrenium voratum]|uniref:Uncharacterized protein n=1 Tax=Effrenium voratum TaxID=2562239 RepID=A0AA36IMF4_9DINO|nr:unnamed protein product [Effrenium voratum]
MAALLPLRARLCAPCCRHISAGKFGKPMHIGAKPQAPAIRSRPEVKVAGSGRIGSPLPTLGTSPHLRALQRLSDMVPGFRGLDMMSSYRDRQARLRARADQQHQSDIFNEAKRFMMEPEMWTFGSMLAYQRKLMDLLGAHSFRRRFATDDPSLAYLEKALRVLEAMTPVELASNHKRVFTPQAIELIGEKSNTSARFVKQVILEHDILRGDRRWYQILAQFDRPQPQSFEDRSFMAEYDRPFSETEIEMRQEMMDKQERIHKDKKVRLSWIWYRHRSCGGNRWSTRPPRWYPAQWKTRTARRSRLAGVGVPGGGGDRGKPWGRLAGWVNR